ncbi:LysR family transcriptional regulator [Undibacterium sp. Ji83W]|uniref:LysR family transcriptional regulator n=1 Tax=Undibacterium sp. Ji83W TaxID=3413043 RepID=UPI003BF21465
MRPSLQQLETFYWIARLGGFHAAAKHLHLTQPTISARIQELEDILGLKLFERGGHRAVITPVGRDVLAQAEKMLRLSDDLEQISKRRNPMRGLLRLGANESTAMSGLIELLGRLKAQYPDVRIELTIDVGANLSRKLNARELDIAILSDPVSAPHVVDVAIGHVDLAWVASTQTVLNEQALHPAGMAALPVVAMPSPTTICNVVMEWFRLAGHEPENLSICNSMAMMIKLVAAGHAIAVLPRAVVDAEIKSGIIRTLTVKPPLNPLMYYVSYLRQEQGLADGNLVTMAREVLQQSGLLLPLTLPLPR